MQLVLILTCRKLISKFVTRDLRKNMAILPIIIAPDPRLKAECDPVEKVTPELVKLMDDMLDTMYDAPGIGLAAVQIGTPLRVIVMDISWRLSLIHI